MAKAVTRYQCEICGKLYDDEVSAVSCEDIGKETPLATVGELVDFRIEMSGGWNDWFVEVRVSDIVDNGHYLIYYFEEYDSVTDSWDDNAHYSNVWGADQFARKIVKKESANANG